MLFEMRKAWEFIADFDHTVSDLVISTCDGKTCDEVLLIGLEKESIFSVIYNWHILIFGRFFVSKLYMSEYPGLAAFESESSKSEIQTDILV